MNLPPRQEELPTVTPMDRWRAERQQLESELGEKITLDALTGPNGHVAPQPCEDDAGGAAGWLIAQRKNGHRHSADDVLTAWYALQVSPPVTAHLDLGTGIGTVGLLTLWGMGPAARLTCVEAQEISSLHRFPQGPIDGNDDGIACPQEGIFAPIKAGRGFASLPAAAIWTGGRWCG